ncbi:hypothetical protein L493_2902 [Bordetella bronchiseptica 99-R-0433]|nr:hypothetical protein L493_2902 [Bordetella bronchiseptica 99-R-0433]
MRRRHRAARQGDAHRGEHAPQPPARPATPTPRRAAPGRHRYIHGATFAMNQTKAKRVHVVS